MELLFALFMYENKSKINNSISSNDSPTERGYLSLQNLSEKYGYAKDYIGSLARAGRLEAVRYGKYGQWYVLEESLKKYQALKLSSKISARYLPLHDLANKYGYAEDHLGWLSRTGRIEAIRHGKYGQWHASEESLEKYQSSLIPSLSSRNVSVVESKIVLESKPETVLSVGPLSVAMSESEPFPVAGQEFSSEAETLPFRIEQLQVETLTAILPSVLLIPPQQNSFIEEENIVLSKNDGSYNADSGVGSQRGVSKEVWDTSMLGNSVGPKRFSVLTHRFNATLTFLVVLGGILIFTNFVPVKDFNKTPIVKNYLKLQTASIWGDFFDWLFSDKRDEVKTYVTIEEFNQLKQTVNNLSISSVGPQGPTGPTGPSGSGETIIKETIIREIVSGPSGQSVDLSSFESRLSFATSAASSANLSIKSYNDSFTTKELTVTEGTTLGSLTTTSIIADTGSVTGDFSIGGTLTVTGNIGIGTSSAPNQLTVVGSGSFTGQLKATRNPTLAHTGTWPSFSNTSDSTFYINPSSPVADGNVIAYVSGSTPKFVVDAEGDIYGSNLILTGSTTTATQTVGDLLVEGSTQLGDASGDQIYFVGTILPKTLSSNIFSVQASPSWSGDYYIRALDSSSNPIFYVASTSAGYFSGNLTVAGTASSSFAGSLDVTKGLNVNSGALRVTQGGNVGIGTTGPGKTLDVTGDIRLSNDLFRGTNRVITMAGGNDYLYDNGQATGLGWGAATTLHIGANNVATKVYAGYLGIGSFYGTNGMFSGNVGIGTTAPTTKLDVIGSASVSQNFEVGGTASISSTLTLGGILASSNTGSNSFAGSLDVTKGLNVNSGALRVTQGGNVGIGTTGPGKTLDVTGDIRLSNDLFRGTNRVITMAGGNDYLYDNGQATGLGWGAATTLHIGANNVATKVYAGYLGIGSFYGTNGMFSGNVGIGTTAPTTKLDVIGSASVSQNFEVGGTASISSTLTLGGILASSNTGSNSFAGSLDVAKGLRASNFTQVGTATNYFNGNVGIGTTAPTSALHVRSSSGNITSFVSTATNGSYSSYYKDTSSVMFWGSELAIRGAGLAVNGIVAGGHTGDGGSLKIYGNYNDANSGLGLDAGGLYPQVDNQIPVGTASKRWTVVYAVNGTIQTSDARMKHDVTDTNLGLDFINKLRPVNYTYNDISGVRQGLIAQEVLSALGTASSSFGGAIDLDPNSGMYGLNYAYFVTPLIKSVQELNLNLESIAGITASSGFESESFATSFFNNLFSRITTWLADAGNGVTDVFAKKATLDQICLKDVNGTSCYTRAQLDAIINNAGIILSPTPTPTPILTPTPEPVPTPTSDPTPTPVPDPTPEITPTPVPETTSTPVPTPTPEIIPDQTPTPEIAPTPVPDPTPEPESSPQP